MADIQRTYALVALGFITAIVAGVTVWPPLFSALAGSIGSVGLIILAILALIPLFVVESRPALWSYLLFSAVTEGFVLSVIPFYAYYLGAAAFAIVLGGAAAFAVIGLFFSERGQGVSDSVGAAAFWMIVLSLLGSVALLVGSFLGWYSWHLDLFTTGIAFVAFVLFAAYDASRVRRYPDEYRAAVRLLIDLVGIVVELLRLVFLLQRRD